MHCPHDMSWHLSQLVKVGSSAGSSATRSSLTKTARICGTVLCSGFAYACLCRFVCSTMLLCLQGLQWLHKRGRAICDLKPDNIRVQMGQQPGTFGHVTLIDLGGSIKFKGASPVHCNCLAYLCVLHISQASDSRTTHFPLFLCWCWCHIFAVLVSLPYGLL